MYESQITEAAGILDRFLKGPGTPAKIAWLLDHQYSPAGLSLSALKGVDAAKARVLLPAAARAQCAAHLVIVHIGESGAAEPDYDQYFYRSRRNRYQYEDEEEEDEETMMKTRASLSLQSTTSGSTWTSGGTRRIVWWSSAAFLLTVASCSRRARSTGNLRTRSA